MEPSYQWTDIGSGTLGKIFVEIIGCDNLPNLDTAGVLGDKTDSFVSLVYEDCFARTDVVDDCLSPRWMPWSHRAFIFNMMHTSSQLFIGVFDSDTNSLCNHDLVGRISIDVSSFRRNTTYLVKYNLFPVSQSDCSCLKFLLASALTLHGNAQNAIRQPRVARERQSMERSQSDCGWNWKSCGTSSYRTSRCPRACT